MCKLKWMSGIWFQRLFNFNHQVMLAKQILWTIQQTSSLTGQVLMTKYPFGQNIFGMLSAIVTQAMFGRILLWGWELLAKGIRNSGCLLFRVRSAYSPTCGCYSGWINFSKRNLAYYHALVDITLMLIRWGTGHTIITGVKIRKKKLKRKNDDQIPKFYLKKNP